MSGGGAGPTNKPAPLVAQEIGMVDGSGKLQSVSATNPLPITGTITAAQASVGSTGAAVPAKADYVAMNVGGNLTGMTGSASGLQVDGSGVTQPVSAASLPLPSGASTAAKQPALGTAGSASADVISVQGIASMTALKTDGSAVTQPVSAASLPLPSGAATAAKQPALGTAGSASADVISVQGIASMTALKVDGSAATQPVSGTVTANAGTGTLTVDQTTAAATFQAEGSITGASLTSSYATAFTTGGSMKWLGLRNATDNQVSVSLDGGTTTHFVLDIGDSVSIDLKGNGLNIATSTAVKAKYTSVATTSGSIRVNGAY